MRDIGRGQDHQNVTRIRDMNQGHPEDMKKSLNLIKISTGIHQLALMLVVQMMKDLNKGRRRNFRTLNYQKKKEGTVHTCTLKLESL